jgi:hypothetical protein
MLAAKELWDALPEMTAVTTCIYTRATGPDVTFVKALATLPALSSFELVDSIFQTTMDPEFNLISGLTRMTFRLTEDWRRHTSQDRWNFSVIQREAYYLVVLLSASASTLEYIEIPGETSCPEELSEHHWPCLRHMVLYGVVPDRPLISWLRQAPLLFIYPDSHFDEAVRLPEIRSLTLANPSPQDHIFDHLSDIHYLSFLVLPEADGHMERVNVLDAPIWNATQAKVALLRCQMPNLAELRISIQDHAYSDLIHAISQMFPSLKVLELHRYPMKTLISAEQFACSLYCVLLETDLLVIIQEISSAFMNLSLLTDLRLDLNLRRWEEAGLGASPSRAYRDLNTEVAVFVAESLPKLESVSILQRGRQVRGSLVGPPIYWKIFNVSRNMGGVQGILNL